MGILKELEDVDNIKLSKDKRAVIIIDQTKLPGITEYLTLTTVEEFYEAILKLRVRGAPAIGICAAYGMYCLAQTIDTTEYEAFHKKFHEYKEYLNSSRPTAVNLSWALNRMEQVVLNNKNSTVKEIIERLESEAYKIQ